jgi:hypothetical protein
MRRLNAAAACERDLPGRFDFDQAAMLGLLACRLSFDDCFASHHRSPAASGFDPCAFACSPRRTARSSP